MNVSHIEDSNLSHHRSDGLIQTEQKHWCGHTPPPSLPPSHPSPRIEPPSLCLPQWLLGSCASCPGWHELMITAAASQSRLIHYVFLAGPAAGLRRFWHWMRKPSAAPFTAHTSNPLTRLVHRSLLLFTAFHKRLATTCASGRFSLSVMQIAKGKYKAEATFPNAGFYLN